MNSKPLPNILLVFTDQQRHDTIAELGNPIIRTPTLDRLAREGTAFTRCYTPSPVCMPARAAMMTGLPPHVTGCVDNANFPMHATSFAEMLSSRGYQTHAVGKLHLGGDWRRGWGFQSRDTSEEVKDEHDYRRFLDRHGFAHVLEPHGPRGEFYYLPQPSQLPARLHETTWVADRSVDFLSRRDRSRPFFLFTSFIKPHPPFEAPAPWHRLYRTREMPPPHVPPNFAEYQSRVHRVQNRYKYMDEVGANDRLVRTQKAAYYGAISFIDFSLQRILASLGDEIDNTLVLFTSDHGEMLGDYRCFGKRGMLEGAVRVPMMARYPKLFRRGARVAATTSLLDVFPTLADVSGSPLRPHVSGRSLVQVVREPGRARVVLSQFGRRWMGHYLATDGRWKYIYSAPDRKEWLFAVTARGLEGRNELLSRRGAPHLRRLRDALRAQFDADNYAEPFRGSGWRAYRVPPFPRDHDYGLIQQDEGALQAKIDALGKDFARKVTIPKERQACRILYDHMP